MLYQVKISFYDCGIKKDILFKKEIDTFDELKMSFLRHFGNINNVPNKLLKDKALVKNLTYNAKDINELISSINLQTSWILSIINI